MKLVRPLVNAVAAGTLVLMLASPVASFAHEGGHFCEQHHRMDAQQRAQFAKKHLDKEAAMLEIKASQQSAWDAYAAAKLDLMSAFDHAKPAADADAATLARQHADRATAMAAKLTALADATDKLQAVLGDDQRKVFNRMAHMHRHCHDGGGEHGHGMHEGMMHGAAKPAAKATAPAKAKE